MTPLPRLAKARAFSLADGAWKASRSINNHPVWTHEPQASAVAHAQVEVWALGGCYTKRFMSRTMPDAPA
ncbi:hypothetical protein GCM10009429_28770 [Dyella marensis]